MQLREIRSTLTATWYVADCARSTTKPAPISFVVQFYACGLNSQLIITFLASFWSLTGQSSAHDDSRTETIPLRPFRHRETGYRNSNSEVMKFSNSLKFNAVADWWDEYIAYSALKKHIYQLEKKQQQERGIRRQRSTDLESNESSALMGHDASSSTDPYFIPLLDQELTKICKFYEAQERKFLSELEDLEELVRMQDEESVSDQRYLDEDEEEDEDEDDEGWTRKSPSRERRQGRVSSGRRRSGSEARAHPAPGILKSLSQESGTSRMQRRLSMSSNEDIHELEASMASLSQIPEDDTVRTSTGDLRRSSPARARTALSNIFNFVKPGSSVTSSQLGKETIWTSKSSYAFDIRALFKRRIATLYNQLTSLRAYVELNYSGFRKILKKYDKVTYNELKDHYMHDVVEEAYPFQQTTKDRLNDAINRLVILYAKCITHGDVAAAARQLKVFMREHIAWERDTVWRTMISQERRGVQDGHVKSLGGHVEEEEAATFSIPTPLGRLRFPAKAVFLLGALIAFIALLNSRVFPTTEANNCFAILVFSTILWATEAIPLFVTSILVPLLLVVFRVFISQEEIGKRLEAHEATKFVFSQMFSPTIMLLIGGFTIASALSKSNIDRVIITRLLSLAGTRPNIVLLAFMGVSCFASMWISNVAAPTLCFTLIKPILRNLPPKASFAPCLIMGIALAANIGGQSSPISSPQNLIALDEMDEPLDWGQWFAVALPVSGLSILFIWLFLLLSYSPSRTVDGEELVIKEIRPTKERFTLKQYWVMFICIFTIALWCVEKKIEGFIGDMGIIAIIPIVAFFATGVLRKDDFEQFLWTVVFLAMGGIALGKGVTSSGLLNILGDGIRDSISGRPLSAVVLALTFIVLIISTFISHTIASVLLVPIAKEVGNNLPGNHQRLLIFLTGLVCSTGMGMPVSGFPNQTAATQEDDLGHLYLSNIDFLKNGVPASIISALVVATIGYGLMLAIGILRPVDDPEDVGSVTSTPVSSLGRNYRLWIISISLKPFGH
ncbi:PHO91 [Sanghuangporus sanghuang]|uniref:SPX-domain-containing protein n=1 Tax=Sanghuangporus baumii TaxID=108892 RepID=A0A9Q5HRV5_SANBA|nr:SPX-domain-containing protein [Sanghuangporus baumii]